MLKVLRNSFLLVLAGFCMTSVANKNEITVEKSEKQLCLESEDNTNIRNKTDFCTEYLKYPAECISELRKRYFKDIKPNTTEEENAEARLGYCRKYQEKKQSYQKWKM